MPDAPPPPSAISNASIAQIAVRLGHAHRVLVLTHTKPDGDAIGSSLALVRALNQRLPGTAQAWYFGPLPVWASDIVGANTANQPLIARFFEPPFDHVPPIDADAVLVTDTCSWTQLEPVASQLRAMHDRVCVLDHHVQGDAGVGGHRYVDTSAAAVVQPAALLCQTLLGVSDPARLPTSVAEALYLGLATDTGWFRHSNVSRRVMTLAGELLDAGANHVRLYQLVEQRESLGRLRLIARALGGAELALSDRLAFLTLSLRDLRESGAMPGETGGLTDFSQAIPSVLVSALISEVPPEQAPDRGAHSGVASMVKISLRSKSEPVGVDVNAIAASLGGGGHVRAAGARVPMTIEQAKAAITRLVAAQLGS